MIEVQGDFWQYKAPVKVITTNGYVKRNGEAVMGRGIALQMAQRYPQIPSILGVKLTTEGNHVHHLGRFGRVVYFSFPVKHVWNEQADITLIRQSTIELLDIMDDSGDLRGALGPILMVRPGCGNGGLKWKDVRKVLRSFLDDRFVVIEWA